jgi:ABC-type lipoprotein export system ATPase subunit
MEIFGKIAKQHQTTLVLVTHSLEIAQRAGRRIVLRDGKVASGYH